MFITYENEISLEAYRTLRDAVGFHTMTERQLTASLLNCELIVTAYDGGFAVGMVRLLWDKGYAFSLYDVMVLPEYQGHGIGREMIERVLCHIKNLSLPGESYLVSLMAAKGKEPFYEKFGFLRRPDEKYGSGMSFWFGN